MRLSAYLLLRRTKWQELEDQFTISITIKRRPTKETVLILVNLMPAEKHFTVITGADQLQAKRAVAKSHTGAKDDEHS
jgi:hypothetical protein